MSSGESQIRVLIVDDHDVLRYGVKALLRQDPRIEVVGEADSVSQAIEAARVLVPDVVLMDARLPDGSGIDACREILSTNPAIHVLFFSAYSDDETVMLTLLAGAAGYVSKEHVLDGLIDAIRTVARGGTVVDASKRDEVRAVISASAEALGSATSALDRLSRQEERIMVLVVEGKTNKEIALALGLSDKTVKNYLRNAFQKMGVGRRAHAASMFDLAREKRAQRERLGSLQARLADSKPRE
jgi:two-component system, NarL family, response regulator DevR